MFPGPSGLDDRDRVTRRIVAEKLACAPGDIQFRLGDTGKPSIEFPASSLSFSRANRPKGWALACSAGCRIGVDLEDMTVDLDTSLVANTLFSPSEQAWVGKVAPPFRKESFLRLWTGKEAVLKACEVGIVEGVAEPDFADSLGLGPWPDYHRHHVDTNFGHVDLLWVVYRPDFLICRAHLS